MENPEIKNLNPEEYFLRHPYGRHGANVKYYYAVTVEEHKAIHHELGYKSQYGGFWHPRDFFEWWQWFFGGF